MHTTTITVTDSNGKLDEYDTQYGAALSSGVDSTVFDVYTNYDCQQVGNLTGIPEICIDMWLDLQFECN
jgi:hypothetical protein